MLDEAQVVLNRLEKNFHETWERGKDSPRLLQDLQMLGEDLEDLWRHFDAWFQDLPELVGCLKSLRDYILGNYARGHGSGISRFLHLCHKAKTEELDSVTRYKLWAQFRLMYLSLLSSISRTLDLLRNPGKWQDPAFLCSSGNSKLLQHWLQGLPPYKKKDLDSRWEKMVAYVQTQGKNFKIYFHGLEWVEFSFKKKRLLQIIMFHGKFTDCDFTKAVIEDCDFKSTVFQGCTFRKTKLLNVNLQHADMGASLFSDLDLTSIDRETFTADIAHASLQFTRGLTRNEVLAMRNYKSANLPPRLEEVKHEDQQGTLSVIQSNEGQGDLSVVPGSVEGGLSVTESTQSGSQVPQKKWWQFWK